MRLKKSNRATMIFLRTLLWRGVFSFVKVTIEFKEMVGSALTETDKNMKIKSLLVPLFCSLAMIGSAETLRWRNARELTIEGQGWTDTKDPYDRFPARAEKIIRPAVWGLSRDSAGICIRFV